MRTRGRLARSSVKPVWRAIFLWAAASLVIGIWLGPAWFFLVFRWIVLLAVVVKVLLFGRGLSSGISSPKRYTALRGAAAALAIIVAIGSQFSGVQAIRALADAEFIAAAPWAALALAGAAVATFLMVSDAVWRPRSGAKLPRPAGSVRRRRGSYWP